MSDLFNTLKRMGTAIANTFGENCEVVIHDLEKELDQSIVFIMNGHVSNRDLNEGASYLVLNVRNNLDIHHEDRFNYIIKSNNKYLKCSSMFFYQNDILKYIFSINFDITDLMKTQEAIGKIVLHQEEEAIDKFPTDVNEMLERLIQQSVELVGKPVSDMNYKEKGKAIRFLDDCGAFLITKATEVVAEFFGISKYTIYNHIK